MSRAEERAKEVYSSESHWFNEDRVAFVKGYEQAIIDLQESFNKMQASTDSAIDAVKVLGSLFDNPNIREKLGKSKPIPKKPIKTNPFFGGEKK